MSTWRATFTIARLKAASRTAKGLAWSDTAATLFHRIVDRTSNHCLSWVSSVPESRSEISEVSIQATRAIGVPALTDERNSWLVSMARLHGSELSRSPGH